MRSDKIKKGVERIPHRALLYATGVTPSEMDRPFIGVATSFTDLIAGHIGMRDMERFIEKGVHTGGGHAFHGISCDVEPYPGMHFVSPDHCVLELVDPETKEPAAMTDGAIGEMVFTFVGWQGGPFMRYALGDLIQIFRQPCSCGWPEMRFKILGRADDMLIIKGVNIYPAAIKSVVGEFVPATTGALRIILDGPGPLVAPPLKLRIEYGQADMTDQQKHDLIRDLAENLGDRLRVKPEIELVAPQSLPRAAGKTSLIEIDQKI